MDLQTIFLVTTSIAMFLLIVVLLAILAATIFLIKQINDIRHTVTEQIDEVKRHPTEVVKEIGYLIARRIVAALGNSNSHKNKRIYGT